MLDVLVHDVEVPDKEVGEVLVLQEDVLVLLVGVCLVWKYWKYLCSRCVRT